MRRLNAILFLALLALIVAEPRVFAQEPVGEVISIQKSPTVRRAGQAETLPLELGSGVFAGDAIVTDNESSAKLLLADDSIIDVLPATTFTVASVGKSVPAQLELSRGRIRALVTKKLKSRARQFEIKTKAAYFGVRGTEFFLVARDITRTEATRHESTVSVLDGTVEVRSRQPGSRDLIQVSAGQSYTVIAEIIAETVKTQPLQPSLLLQLSSQQEARLREERLSQTAILSASALHTFRTVGQLLPSDKVEVAQKTGEGLFDQSDIETLVFGPGTNYINITVGFPP